MGNTGAISEGISQQWKVVPDPVAAVEMDLPDRLPK